MFIPEDIVEQIKNKANLVEIIGRYTELKKKGKDYIGLCPFHNEKSPSFSVNAAKDIWKCFGCDKGGHSVFSFLMDKENLTYPEALKWLADFYNIYIPPEKTFSSESSKEKTVETDPVVPVLETSDENRPPKRGHGEFFKQTLRSIGLSNDKNKVDIKWLGKNSQSETIPLISEDRDGNLEFIVYDINGFVITYDKNGKTVPYKVVRLKEPMLNSKDGKMMKYIIPKGVGTRPFFPPGLMQKFNEASLIPTLFLTEGYKKSIAGWINGLDIVGLTSISTYRDKDTMQIHRDIVDLIVRCKVQNVVLLYDGDCANISSKALQEEKDISIRPNNFFSSARGIKELLKDYLKDQELDLYFAHINSDSVEGHPKGLDDIYEAMLAVQFKAIHKDGDSRIQQGRSIVEAKRLTRLALNSDLTAFSKPGTYFTKINITFGLKKLEQHLAMENATSFYLRHQEEIKDRRFTYFGTQYKYNTDRGECEVIIPAASKNYVRVGDDYYEKVPVPNKYKDLEMQLHRRSKSTISDDHGKNFITHVQKFKAFCNIPDHVNYQEVVHNCFNMYSRFKWEPEEGEYSQTLEFLKHIFEEHYEYGLDYIQLLYQRPTQILPILCLVSKENTTGKTTFAKWLKLIFDNNMAIVGNSDLSNDFNGFWSTRLLICCDEAFIEKNVIVERIKSLSTADRITMNQKGRDQVEIEFFGKFIMLTNKEDNFIYATEDDIRYWVRKIKTPVNKNVDLLAKLKEEIPAFLNFLNSRKISTSNQSRMWFMPHLLVTDALRRVVAQSKTTVEKEIRTRMQSLFEDFGENMITMTVSDIRKEFFNNRYEEKYVLEILRDQMKIEQYWDPGPDNTKIFKVKRYEYPKQHMDYSKNELQKVQIKSVGRPFVFLRPDFISRERDALIYTDPELFQYNTDVPAHFWRTGMISRENIERTPIQADLPF